MMTGRFCWPCWPLFGLTDSRIGVPGPTVKPLFRVPTSPLVAKVTARAPIAAAASTLRIAVALVRDLTLRDATVTPAPKLAWLAHCRKWLDWPVRVTDRFCCPGCPLFGL